MNEIWNEISKKDVKMFGLEEVHMYKVVGCRIFYIMVMLECRDGRQSRRGAHLL